METTGRKFKCIGLMEETHVSWSDHFNVGEIYEEVLYLGAGHFDDSLVLITINDWFVVDSNQFELIEGDVKEYEVKQNYNFKASNLFWLTFALTYIWSIFNRENTLANFIFFSGTYVLIMFVIACCAYFLRTNSDYTD